MRTVFIEKQISGILTVFPKDEYSFEDSLKDDAIKRARRLKRIMGFDKRRRVKTDTNSSDLYCRGIDYLLEKGLIKPEEIGAVITVTLTQDYLTPSISSIIHDYLDLSKDVICADIPQACTGYVVGLIEAFSLLEYLEDKKVLLCTGDVLNRIRQNEEKRDEPSFGGDAASISIIENNSNFGKIYCNYYSDGENYRDLIMPVGGFAHPVYSEEDAMISEDGETKNGLHIIMDGSNVFNFIQREVPPMIDDLFGYSGYDRDDIDLFLFHQPNRFILEKLAEKMQVPKEKMYMDIVEKYGNSNASTIPAVITDSVPKEMLEEKRLCCLAGFGAGLSWASLIMELGEMTFCEEIEVDL